MNRTITINQSEFQTLYEILEQRLNKRKEYINKHSEKLDKYESDIKNYTTYDLFMKLHAIKTEEDIKEGALSDLYIIEGDDNAYKNHDYRQEEAVSSFIEEVYEIAFGDDAINREYDPVEVLERLKEFSDNALKTEEDEERVGAI